MYSNEEIIELKKQVEQLNDKIDTLLKRDYTIHYLENTTSPYVPEACKYCPTHPSNGGSGICNCTLGLPKITC